MNREEQDFWNAGREPGAGREYCQDDFEYDSGTGLYAHILIPIEYEIGTIIHTVWTPFCNDPMCPCHADMDDVSLYLTQPLADGLLTSAEATRLYYGQQLA